MKLLRVKGRKFVAGILFHKVNGEWKVWDMAPILRRILGSNPGTNIIPLILRDKNLEYEWID